MRITHNQVWEGATVIVKVRPWSDEHNLCFFECYHLKIMLSLILNCRKPQNMVIVHVHQFK